jgi:hypothetical protein
LRERKGSRGEIVRILSGRRPKVIAGLCLSVRSEISGAAARHAVQDLTLHHRMRGSRGVAAAAAAIVDRASGYGMEDVGIIRLPADGIVFYATPRSRPAWNAGMAELREMVPSTPSGAQPRGREAIRPLIRDDLAAIYGPVPCELVAGYLELLASAGLLSSR